MSGRQYSERHRRQRVKNYAVLAAILSFCVIVYVVFIVRSGGMG